MKFIITSRTKTILTGVLVLATIAIVISWWLKKKPSGYVDDMLMYQGTNEELSPYATFEHFMNGGESPKVMLFYATWCGHCEKYLSSGIFDKVSQSPEVQGVSFQKFDADQNEDLRDKYDVTGFPTILGVNSKGEKVTFEGNRNNETEIVAFAKSLMM